MGASGLGCRRAHREADEALATARATAALAWVVAWGASDDATLAALTADPLIFRSVHGVGEAPLCEGVVAGPPAQAAWRACVRGRADLRRVSDSWPLYRQPPADTTESAALARYLPHVVSGDDAWNRFVGAAERARAREPFEAILKEGGNDGDWITIAANGLAARMVLRLRVVGTPARVRAVLVDVTDF